MSEIIRAAEAPHDRHDVDSVLCIRRQGHDDDLDIIAIALGNRGRNGRSILRAIRMASVEGRPSRLKKPPGILPATHSVALPSRRSGEKSPRPAGVRRTPWPSPAPPHRPSGRYSAAGLRGQLAYLKADLAIAIIGRILPAHGRSFLCATVLRLRMSSQGLGHEPPACRGACPNSCKLSEPSPKRLSGRNCPIKNTSRRGQLPIHSYSTTTRLRWSRQSSAA